MESNFKPFTVKSGAGKLLITSVSYHRNGVAGNGFSVVIFRWNKTMMHAAIFEERGNVAVFQTDALTERWRGDDFEDGLREAILTAENLAA